MSLDLSAGVLLRLSYKPNARWAYKCHTTVTQECLKNGLLLGINRREWDTMVSQRVLCLDEEDGEELAHILTISQPQGLDYPDDDPLHPLRQVMYSQVNSRGIVLETAGGVAANSCVYPVEPVQKGSIWRFENTVTLPGMPGSQKCVSSYTVTGLETINGHECVRAEMGSAEAVFKMDLPTGEKARVVSSSRGVIHFCPELGLPLRIELITSGKPKIGDLDFNSETRVLQELLES